MKKYYEQSEMNRDCECELREWIDSFITGDVGISLFISVNLAHLSIDVLREFRDRVDWRPIWSRLTEKEQQEFKDDFKDKEKYGIK